MASSGKKGKKSKGKTFQLNEFLAKTRDVTPSRYVARKSNWADEIENEDDFHDASRKEKVVLPTGPRATCCPEVDDSRIPVSAPYLAYVTNLPYDVDEDEITAFFKDLKILNVRLPREDRQGTGKLKGFGYVEFDSRQSLIAALSMPDTTIKSRRVRIAVADHLSEMDRRRGGREMMRGGDMMGGRDRPDGPDRTLGDWRSGPRDEVPHDSDRDRDRGGGFRDRDGGFDRAGRLGGGRREFGSGSFRDSFGDRDRGSGGGGFRESRDNFGDRDRDRGRFSDRDGYDRGGFSDRYGDRERERERDRDYGRDGGYGRRTFTDYNRDGGGSFRGSRDEAPPPERAEPKSRPRLNLKPRTIPVDDLPVSTTAPVPAPASAPSGAPASIFGGAKPVDTAAREREIEARLARERVDLPRPPPKNDRVERSEDIRSKSSSEHGDRDDDGSRGPPPRRMEPAPPPNENYWAQRPSYTQDSQQEYSEGNGCTSPHSEPSDHEQERGPGESQPRHQERSESPRRKSQDHDDRQQMSRGLQRRQFERDDRGGRYDRGGRGVPRVSGVDRGAPVREKQKGRGDGRMSDRDGRREVNQDDAARMPKYHEQEAPNFAGSNKFAYLHNDEEPGSD